MQMARSAQESQGTQARIQFTNYSTIAGASRLLSRIPSSRHKRLSGGRARRGQHQQSTPSPAGTGDLHTAHSPAQDERAQSHRAEANQPQTAEAHAHTISFMNQYSSIAMQSRGPMLGGVLVRPHVDDSLMGLKTLISILNSNATEDTLLLILNKLLALARDRRQLAILFDAGIIAPLVQLSDYGVGEVKTKALAFLIVLAENPRCRDAILSVWYPLDDPLYWAVEQLPAFTPIATKPAPMPMQMQPLNHYLPYMCAPNINESYVSRTPSPPSSPILTSTPPTPSLPASTVLFEDAQETLPVESAPCADSYSCEDFYLCFSEATETDNELIHASVCMAESFDEGMDEGFVQATAKEFADGVVDGIVGGVAAGPAAEEAAGEAAGRAGGLDDGMLDGSDERMASPASVDTTVLYEEGEVLHDHTMAAWGNDTAATTTATEPILTNAQQSVLRRKRWSDLEDVVLSHAVEHYGSSNWAMVCQSLPGRTSKQCRERWRNHLRSGVCKDAWSDGEMRRFDDLFMVYGRRWATIAKYLPGRTDSAVKNMWYATYGATKPKAPKPVRRLVRKRI